MALVADKFMFLHIPKTGGMWIRHAIKVLGIDHFEVADQHTHFTKNGENDRLLAAHSKEFYKNKFIFSFVRHPLSWYQSRWAFRMKHGWRPSLHPLDFNCASNDFAVFVDNAIRYRPTGWVTEEYTNFIDNVPWPINFIGRCENIVEDLITALKLSGEDVDESLVRSIPKINDSDLDGKPPKFWAPYTIELIDRVLATESVPITRYYSDYKLEIDAWCKPRPY